MSHDVTPQQFAARVQLCRREIVTPTELFYYFMQGVADHASQLAEFYKLLP
jgi:hypothetical protein